MATFKSRVSELEGSLSFAQENTNKVRQQALFDQERLTTIMKEVSNIFSVFWEVSRSTLVKRIANVRYMIPI